MRATIRIGAAVWAAMREYLLDSPDERAGYLLARAGVWTTTEGTPALDLLVTRAIPVPDAALRIQDRVRVEIDETFTREVLVACYETGLSLIDVHTHPFTLDSVHFSGHDVANMRVTHAQFLATMPADPPRAAASLVLGQRSVAGAFTGPDGGRLHSLDRMQLLCDHVQEVPL
jgi:hypothetical protein